MNEPIPVDRGVDLVSAALVLAQGAVKAAEFDATNPFFKSRYATLGSVIEASRAALLSSGLAILQTPSIRDNLVTLKTTIVHKSGQSLDGGTMTLPLEGNDRNSDAQVAGSIITYLKRYAWASVLGVYADQDTDGNDAPKGAVKAPTAATKPSDVKVGPRYRLQTLNRLEAAPGQPRRGIVEDYLRSKLWITDAQTADDFPLEELPRDASEFEALSAAIQRFEVSRREEGQPFKAHRKTA